MENDDQAGVTPPEVQDPRGAEIPPEKPAGTPPAKAPEVTDPETAEAAQRDHLPPDGADPTPEQAGDALSAMLNADGPPPVSTERMNMKELAERLEAKAIKEGKLEKPSENPEFWVTVRGLGERELEQLSDRAVKPPTKQQRKLGMTKGAPDQARMKRLICATAMIEPNLNDQRILAKYGPTAEQVVQRWFLPGEIDQISETVNDLTGYSAGAVERAKE